MADRRASQLRPGLCLRPSGEHLRGVPTARTSSSQPPEMPEVSSANLLPTPRHPMRRRLQYLPHLPLDGPVHALPLQLTPLPAPLPSVQPPAARPGTVLFDRPLG
nr:hypothetical protein CFP56_28657 [Quercus suber]